MLLIAHRSGPDTYPEQTVQSGREALSLGADLVEIDARLTADGQAAMSHDPSTLRVFGVDKPVIEMTASEFKSLRHVKDPAFCAHMIADVFASGLKPLLVHIKEPRVLPALLKVIDEYDYASHVTIGVPNLECVRMVRAHDPLIKILSFMNKVDLLQDMIDEGVEYIRLWEDWLTQERVDMIKNSDAQLWVMSGRVKVNAGYPSEEALKKILSYEPDGLLINEILFAKKVISQM